MLALFAVDTARNAPETFTAIVVITVASVILDALFRRSDSTGGETQAPPDQGVGMSPAG